MQWQDWVFSVGSWIFIASLIPSIKGKNKPEFSTSWISAVILTIFSINYLTLGLWLSAISTAGTTIGWTILAYQGWKKKNNK